MKNISICGGCGRTLERDFVFCPYCGQSKMQNDEKAALEAVYQDLEQRRAEEKAKQLAKLEKQLDDLEQDLSILVLSAEMAK